MQRVTGKRRAPPEFDQALVCERHAPAAIARHTGVETRVTVDLGSVFCVACCDLSTLQIQRQHLVDAFQKAGKMDLDLMTGLDKLRKSTSASSREALNSFRKLAKEKVRLAEEAFVKQQLEATAPLQAELMSMESPANPVVSWRVHNVAGVLLSEGSEQLGSVSHLHDVTVQTVISKLGQDIADVAKDVRQRLIEGNCFDWQAACKVDAGQYSYDPNDLGEMGWDSDFENMIEEQIDHCKQASGMAHFRTSKGRLCVAIEVTNKRKTASGDAPKTHTLILDLHEYRNDADKPCVTIGHPSVLLLANALHLKLPRYGGLCEKRWFPDRMAHMGGSLALMLEFQSKETRNVFKSLFEGLQAVLGRRSDNECCRLWALAQASRAHLSDAARDKMDLIASELRLDMWDELLKRPPPKSTAAVRRRRRPKPVVDKLPAGVSLVPTSSGTAHVLTATTRMSQLMANMQGDDVLVFNLDLTLTLAPLKPKAYDFPWNPI